MMKILFLCTHNACRSVLSEAITRHHANGRIDVASAGSHPAGIIHEQTLHHLSHHGYPTANLHSKGFDDVADFHPNAVITVCDKAARESCPVWMGSAVKAHWGLPDPTSESSEAEMTAMFGEVIATIEQRIARLLAVPQLDVSHDQLSEILQGIVAN